MEAYIGFEKEANEELNFVAVVAECPPTRLKSLKKTIGRLRKQASLFFRRSALDASPVFWLSECLSSNR
jgi:hypothetical protein